MADQACAFAAFRARHPRYGEAIEKLESAHRALAISAWLVHDEYGSELETVASEILAFSREHFGSNYVDRYIARTHALNEMQRRFDRNPNVETLGDPAARVHRDDYDISLLLSFVFAIHRFEILRALGLFFDSLKARKPDRRGRIACVGIGTGYELRMATQRLPGWVVEGYDSNPNLATASALLKRFELKEISLYGHFPLIDLDPDYVDRYDGIVLCELLEHLPDPERALSVAGRYLNESGAMYATMAVNIAQEDHIFLYSDIAACRGQIDRSQLKVRDEWLAPMRIARLSPGADREKSFVRGNYIATLERRLARDQSFS
jgi:SAM-dependent methyltransferase